MSVPVDGPPPFDPREVLRAIAEDGTQQPVHRVRAARALLSAQPKRRLVSDEHAVDPVIARAAAIYAGWHAKSGAMPTAGEHRGIPLHHFQNPERIADVVAPAIDAVLGCREPVELVRAGRDVRQPPEARILAHAVHRALQENRATSHESRLADGKILNAATAGLDSLRWASPWHFCSLLDTWPPGVAGPAPRPLEFVAQLKAAADK